MPLRLKAQRTLAERSGFLERTAPNERGRHRALALPVRGQLMQRRIRRARDLFAARRSTPAIDFERLQGAIERTMDEVAKIYRIQDERILAAGWRAPPQDVLPDKPQRIAQKEPE